MTGSNPLDLLSLLDESAWPGCEITVRPVGVFWMSDEHGPDAKILSVPARDPRYADVQDFGDVPDFVLTKVSHFFDVYKELEPGKGTDVRGWQGRDAAEQEIGAAVARCDSEPVAGRHNWWLASGDPGR